MAKRWYIIHAYSNFETKVAESIREQAKHRHLDHLFEEIIVPTEKLVEVRHGQKHATERKFFPGYVLAKAADKPPPKLYSAMCLGCVKTRWCGAAC
jgi:transcription termination/antitermination protein NusG